MILVIVIGRAESPHKMSFLYQYYWWQQSLRIQMLTGHYIDLVFAKNYGMNLRWHCKGSSSKRSAYINTITVLRGKISLLYKVV